MTRFRTLGAALFVTLASCRPDPGATPSTGGTVTRISDSTGTPSVVTRSERYLFAWVRSDPSSAQVLIRERATSTCCTQSEHPVQSEFELTRLDVDSSGHSSEKWHWRGELDEGSVDQGFYRGINEGCCDANDMVTLISVETGEEVLHYSRIPIEDLSEPAEIDIPNSGLHRYVGFAENYQLPPRDSVLGRMLLGVIEYGDGKSPPRRWALYSDDVDACCRFQSLRVARTDSGGPGFRSLQLWRDVVDVRRQSIGGVDLVLSFPSYDGDSSDPADHVVRVPVMNDDLDLQHIRGPRGWTVRKIP